MYRLSIVCNTYWHRKQSRLHSVTRAKLDAQVSRILSIKILTRLQYTAEPVVAALAAVPAALGGSPHVEEHPGSAAAHACSLLLRSASRKGSCAVLAQIPPFAQDLLSAISVVGCETDVVPGISERLRSQAAAAERSSCCCTPLLAGALKAPGLYQRASSTLHNTWEPKP